MKTLKNPVNILIQFKYAKYSGKKIINLLTARGRFPAKLSIDPRETGSQSGAEALAVLPFPGGEQVDTWKSSEVSALLITE